jgi:hypothetical protein
LETPYSDVTATLVALIVYWYYLKAIFDIGRDGKRWLRPPLASVKAGHGSQAHIRGARSNAVEFIRQGEVFVQGEGEICESSETVRKSNLSHDIIPRYLDTLLKEYVPMTSKHAIF